MRGGMGRHGAEGGVRRQGSNGYAAGRGCYEGAGGSEYQVCSGGAVNEQRAAWNAVDVFSQLTLESDVFSHFILDYSHL
jgi:hypothetical protein